jgi:septum formation protein
MTVRLVLASASPRRADILRQLGLDPEIRPADVDESYLPGETPVEHVERLARAKAEAGREGGILVVGGDTVVLESERVLAKPADAEDAVAMLRSLAGKTHVVLSGVALSGDHGTVSTVVSTSVRMSDYDEAFARAYVATGEPLDKAGAYGIQGQGAALVEAIEGDYYSVVGFPVGAFLRLVEQAGWRFTFGALTPESAE